MVWWCQVHNNLRHPPRDPSANQHRVFQFYRAVWLHTLHHPNIPKQIFFFVSEIESKYALFIGNVTACDIEKLMDCIINKFLLGTIKFHVNIFTLKGCHIWLCIFISGWITSECITGSIYISLQHQAYKLGLNLTATLHAELSCTVVFR